jgi:ABC-type nitrate/sulfonate/bicarbonate transport system permease component
VAPVGAQRGSGVTRIGRFSQRAAIALGLPLVLLSAWWMLSANSTSFFAPPLRDIVTTFREVWIGPRLGSDVLPSVLRLAAGYTVAVLLGVALGVVIGSNRKVRAFLEPMLEFFRAIPPPVLVPILILVVGVGDTMKVAVIISGCIWPVLLNTVEGVRAVDEVLTDTCRAYGITGPDRLRYLVLRAASPQILAGMRQALSVAIILMVISEMVAANNGLGFTIVQFQRSFAIPEMWSGILMLGTLGFALSVVFRAFESRVLGWYFGQRRAQRGSA